MHPSKQSVHYQGMGWANKQGNQPPNQNPGAVNSPNPNLQQQPNQFPNTYSQKSSNPMLQNQNNPNNPNNRQRNFTNKQNYGPQNMQQMQQMNNGSVRNMNPQMRVGRPPQNRPNNNPNSAMNMQQMRMAQSMNAQQMRNSVNPNMASQAQMRNIQQQNRQMNPQMNPQNQNRNAQMNPQMRKSMPPKQMQPGSANPSVPAPPGANAPKQPMSPTEDNEDIYGKYQKNRGNNLQQRPNHFQSNSAGNVSGPPGQSNPTQIRKSMPPNQGKGPQHRKDNKTKIFGHDPSVPAPPNSNQNRTGNASIAHNPNVKPNQLTPQQLQQMNAIQKQNQMYRQKQQMMQQNASVRNVHGHQRQVQRRAGPGGWGPHHPYYRQYMMQRQRQMQMQRGGAQNNPHYRQWQQYYQRMMRNPQGQLQQMIMQQQQMIANLKRQLQDRDKHYHKTIQTTINFKDMEINELRGQIGKLEEENDEIGQLQVQNFQMKKELNNLRGDHQANVFDNLFDKISGAVTKNKVKWPGGKPPVSPPVSSTIEAGGKDPKAALNAMLKAKSTPSALLLTTTDDEKKKDTKSDGKYAKYAKMKKIGMPMVSIVNKMRMDGMSAQEIEEYTGEKVGGSSSAPKTAAPAVNIADERFAKYKRMKKLRMPIKSILNKMKLDGFKQHEIDAFAGKKSGGQSAADKKKARLDEQRQLAETMGLNAVSEVLPSKVTKMKRIHWDIVELAAIRKTYWWELNQDTKLPEHIDLGGKFELDFQVRARKPRLVSGKGKIMGGLDAITGNSGQKKKKGDRITWIGAKRDQSIQIALKRVGLPNEVIYDSILDMDEEVMNLDILEVVWDIVPDQDEQALAEAKVDQIGDDMDNVGISEMFHVEMSTIPEVKKQLSKWLFARTFREVYMDRLGQVTVMQKCANTIKHSLALQTYFRIILSMGNLMNHGTVKGMAYGFKLQSVNKLLRGVKDYGGKKDLGMWLYQFAYNLFPATRNIFEELPAQLKKARRLEVTTIESSIVKMADEFTAIDLFMRRLHDDFHPGDTEKFRQYMTDFQDRQSADMMNLKVKIQNSSSICKQVAKFYSIDLEEGKPEFLFVVVNQFIQHLADAKRHLLKLEKERLKAAAKAAKQAAKRKKAESKNSEKNPKNLSVADRVAHKKQKAIEDEEKGNLLFLDIKNAANSFAARQEQMAAKLESTLKEKRELAKGKVSASAQKDAIKRRVSAQVMDGGDGSVGGLDMEEIKRLRAMNIGGGGPMNEPMGNSLMVPGMGMEPAMGDMSEEMKEDMTEYGSVQAPQMGNIDMNGQQPMQEEFEDMNQDIDVQQPGGVAMGNENAQWDEDDF